jgi:fatty acid desaturase (delta-4 desaturase)
MSPNAVPGGQIRVENKLYSVEKLSEIHPGGPLFIKAFAGRDASQAFISYHRRSFPHSRVKSAFERVDETVDYSPEDHDDFMELCERVAKVIPRLKSWAPWPVYVKAAFIWGTAIALEFYMHYYAFYWWPLSIAFGFVGALIGLNIQHDANHGAFSRNPRVNQFFGLGQNYIGGSSVEWIHQHVVQHHLHTNDITRDPDMQGNPMIRLNPLAPLKKFQVVQHVYFVFLCCFYGFTVLLNSTQNVIKGMHYTMMSPELYPYRVFDFITGLIFYLRLIVLPVYQTGSLYTCLQVAPAFMTTGFYLAFFFLISHNFQGAHIQEDTTRPSNKNGKKNSYLYKQISSSSNVGGWWLAQLNGGLNYQIEHHLFPRMNHIHYTKIAPVVKQFCEERDIPYVHFPSITANFLSCSAHMWDMGHTEPPAGAKKEEEQILYIALSKIFKIFNM